MLKTLDAGPEYNAMVRSAPPLIESKHQRGGANYQALMDIDIEHEQAEVEDQLDWARVCRADETYKPGHHKVTVFISPAKDSWRKVIVSAFVQGGAQRTQGRPPKVGIEMDMEGWLQVWIKD